LAKLSRRLLTDSTRNRRFNNHGLLNLYKSLFKGQFSLKSRTKEEVKRLILLGGTKYSVQGRSLKIFLLIYNLLSALGILALLNRWDLTKKQSESKRVGI
jgi:hypothetical protein